MDWTGTYDDVVRHAMPRAEPYAALLRTTALACRSPLATWTKEALAMLGGSSMARDQADLEMLATMVERGCLAMLPAHDLSDLVIRALQDERISTGNDRTVTAMLEIASMIVQDVVQAVHMLSSSTPNARAETACDARRIEQVGLMAASIVLPLVPACRMDQATVGRRAA